MTGNCTVKTSFKHTLYIATGLIATAWISNAFADDALRTASVPSIAPVSSPQSSDLFDNGDHVKLAIGQFEKKVQKPEWREAADDLEPCINGGVSASGAYPTQSLEELHRTNTAQPRNRTIRRLTQYPKPLPTGTNIRVPVSRVTPDH